MKKLYILLLLLPILSKAQITLNPTGATRTMIPGITLINNSTTETALLTVPDTVKANTLVGKPYKFMLLCKITTPAVSIPTLTIRIKFGSQVLTLFNGISLLGSQTTQPFVVEGYIFPITNSTQLVWARINQTPGTALTLNSTNTSLTSDWTAALTSQNLFNITAQWGGFTLGTAVLQSNVFYRYDF